VLGISLKTLYNRLSEYRTAGHVPAEPVGAPAGAPPQVEPASC